MMAGRRHQLLDAAAAARYLGLPIELLRRWRAAPFYAGPEFVTFSNPTTILYGTDALDRFAAQHNIPWFKAAGDRTVHRYLPDPQRRNGVVSPCGKRAAADCLDLAKAGEPECRVCRRATRAERPERL